MLQKMVSCYLILGGQAKGQQFGELTPLINQYVSQVLIIGEDAALIEQHRDAELSDDVRLHQCRDVRSGFYLRSASDG